MAELYRKVIIQHFRQRRNWGTMRGATKEFTGVNYFCGDRIKIYVKLDHKNRIRDVRWQGSGCAIVQAATSLFSEMIKDKPLAAVQKMDSAKLLKKLDANLSPMRIKCALLPLYTIRKEKNEPTPTPGGVSG